MKTFGFWSTWLLLYEEYSQFHPGPGLDGFMKWESFITHTFPFLQTGLNSAPFGAMPKVKKTQFEGRFCFLTQHWETYIKDKKNHHYN